MPIYEFRCADCSAVTSHFTRKREIDAPVPCEKCGSANTARMISNFAATVAGSGGTSGGDRPFEFRDRSRIGESMEKRFEQYGMDLPEKARKYIDAARSGDMPGLDG